MGELKYRAETSVNGLGEAVKVIGSQAQRMESALREFKSMAEYAEKIEAENVQLKKQVEEMEKRTREMEKSHAQQMAKAANN
jgi:hypothetical protein